MGRIGLNVKQLTTQEIIELFYDIYNPAPTGTQRVILDTESYTTPIVEPAVEIPSQPVQTSSQPVNQPQAQPSNTAFRNSEQDQTTQGLSETQTKALEDLQTTTQKAAQFVNQAKAPFTQTNTQQNSQMPNQTQKVV